MKPSLDNLRVKQGETVTPQHVNALADAVERSRRLPSPNTRRKEFPWGTHVTSTTRGGASSHPVFRPAVSIANGEARVSWTGPRALIGGVAPTIEKIEIFANDPATRKKPFLTVRKESFSEIGECGIYFRISAPAAAAYRAVTVTPIASPTLPVTEPFFAHKLALFLRIRRGKISYVEEEDRELFSSIAFTAALVTPAGRFEPIFGMV